MEPFLDSDSDDDHEQHAPQRVPRQGRAPHPLPLHQFLRLIAGGPGVMMDHGAAGSNDELVSNLQRAGVISNEGVAAAMRICSRDLFVPENHKEEAFFDAPIRIEDLEFNISAPHMHSTMLEALEVPRGSTVLDVGSGCGIIAAACALLTGPEGTVVGIDIRRECCEMARKSVEILKETSPEFRSTAGSCSFESLNAFLLAGTQHIGKYDRVHVGASCPADHLRPLLSLLKPEGGSMVVPVTPSDLRLIRKDPNGRITQRVISQVRFSDLEVPGDAEVVLAAMKAERKSRTSDTMAPSTFDQDVSAVMEAVRWKKGIMLSSSPAGTIDGFPQSPYAASGSAGHNGTSVTGCQINGSLAEALGKTDCLLVRQGEWEMAAHSAVLCQRCDVLRARCNSGMADAELTHVSVPEHFSYAAVSAFLQYLYTNKLDCTAEMAVEVLHVAQYYGVLRCAQMCEHMLAKVLKSAQRSARAAEGAAEAASSLLALADDQGLSHLSAVALDFVVEHHDIVSKTDSYKALSKAQVELVAAEACNQLSRAKQLLHEVKASERNALPDP